MPAFLAGRRKYIGAMIVGLAACEGRRVGSPVETQAPGGAAGENSGGGRSGGVPNAGSGGVASGGTEAGASSEAGRSTSGGSPNTGGAPPSTCDGAVERLGECGVAGDAVDCAGADADPNAACHFGCYSLSSCGDIADALCTAAPNRFASCLARCGEFRCSDGSGILSSWWCDGMEDCSDGGDEVDCPPPAECSDGSGLAPAWVCDGFPDCADAGDEVGCSFACTGGGSVPREDVCNGAEDCGDGSDERPCAPLVCGLARL